MNAYLFGVGSSRGTLGQSLSPTAKEFGRHLDRWPREERSLIEGVDQLAMHLHKKYRDLSMEEIWTWLDYYAKFSRSGSALEKVTWWTDAYVSLMKALSWTYGPRCDDAAEQLPVDGAFTLNRLVSQIEEGDMVISFNWDTVVERVCRKHGQKLLTFWNEYRPDRINFAKPHGSMSWVLDHDTRTLCSHDLDGSPLFKSMETTQISNRRREFVIGAVPMKAELIEEVQIQHGFGDVYDTLMRQWSAVVEAVRRAERLIVVGYSFPPEDQYGQFFLEEAIRLRISENSRQHLRVEFYELDDRAAEVARNIVEALRHPGLDVQWIGPVTEADPPAARE